MQSARGRIKMTVQCITRRYMRFACCNYYMGPYISQWAHICPNRCRIEREITQSLLARYSKVAPYASRLGSRSSSQSIIGQGSCQQLHKCAPLRERYQIHQTTQSPISISFTQPANSLANDSVFILLVCHGQSSSCDRLVTYVSDLLCHGSHISSWCSFCASLRNPPRPRHSQIMTDSLEALSAALTLTW
jgi:hypothetical protein